MLVSFRLSRIYQRQIPIGLRLERELAEQRYLDIVKRYSKVELDQYSEMLALLLKALQVEAGTEKLKDVLGEIYHELGLHNKWKGQVFTPQNVCDMMGVISLGESPSKEKITVSEPCVGSGAMVLGFVNVLISQKLNYTRNLEVVAVDNDLKCVHMAFLQFSIYGIPATVIHGNTITNEKWSYWRTPMLFIKL